MGFKTGSDNPTTITGTVKSISLNFDEGTDTGPDYFGAAVLDNIDFDQAIVGRG